MNRHMTNETDKVQEDEVKEDKVNEIEVKEFNTHYDTAGYKITYTLQQTATHTIAFISLYKRPSANTLSGVSKKIVSIYHTITSVKLTQGIYYNYIEHNMVVELKPDDNPDHLKSQFNSFCDQKSVKKPQISIDKQENTATIIFDEATLVLFFEYLCNTAEGYIVDSCALALQECITKQQKEMQTQQVSNPITPAFKLSTRLSKVLYQKIGDREKCEGHSGEYGWELTRPDACLAGIKYTVTHPPTSEDDGRDIIKTTCEVTIPDPQQRENTYQSLLQNRDVGPGNIGLNLSPIKNDNGIIIKLDRDFYTFLLLVLPNLAGKQNSSRPDIDLLEFLFFSSKFPDHTKIQRGLTTLVKEKAEPGYETQFAEDSPFRGLIQQAFSEKKKFALN